MAVPARISTMLCRFGKNKTLRCTVGKSSTMYCRFALKDNFNRADPVLMQLKPEQRKAFLRDWWDAAPYRMYEGYVQQVSTCGVTELLDLRDGYIDVLNKIVILQLC